MIATTKHDKVTIHGPKDIGTYVVEFRRAEGETLAISMPRGETDCVQTLQGLDALTGLVVEDVKTG